MDTLPLYGPTRASSYGLLRSHLIEARKLADGLGETDWGNVFHEITEVCTAEIRSLVGPR